MKLLKVRMYKRVGVRVLPVVNASVIIQVNRKMMDVRDQVNDVVVRVWSFQ
jgi:hypothetical protein